MRGASRFAIIGVVGGMAAACSSDSMRFSETPFANPFASKADAEPTNTGSIDTGASSARLPRSSVSSAPLAAPARVAAAPVYNRPTVASAAPPSGRAAGWSVEGGTPITVGDGDTLTSLASRYGVPPAAILSSNGVTASQVAAGRRLVIPVYSATGRAVAAAPAPRAAAPLAEARPPERRPQVAQAQEPRAAEPRAAEPKKIRPGRETAAARPAAPAAPAKLAEKAPATGKLVKSEPLPAAKPKLAEAKVEKAKPAAKPVAQAEAPKVAEAPKPSREPEVTASIAPAAPAAVEKGDFRWPARGRVISGFAGSGANEGINIAVPDGTPVKAAEAGTVAYAGSEVKGYGNLVLIRHDNGYVSAYAHNGDIDVKRGQKVTRGQTIAKSGQTGNVTSPQLHFEIRKGSTPVDPMKYLASN